MTPRSANAGTVHSDGAQEATLAASEALGEPLKPMRYHPDPRGGWISQVAELWEYRELLWMFFLRDLKIRYRQVLVGLLWCVLQPTLGMLIFLTIFWLVKASPTDERVRYASAASILYLGMLIWQFVASSLRDATGVLVNYRHVITKIAFPRIILPLASVLCAAFDFCIALFLLPLVSYFTGDAIRWTAVVGLPLAMVFLSLAVIGAAAWLSSLNAFYRDVGYALPFALQIGMFLAPVIYDSSRIRNSAAIAPWLKTLYASNPVAAAIDWARASVLGAPVPGWAETLLAIAFSAVLLWSGLAWFRRQDQRLADRI